MSKLIKLVLGLVGAALLLFVLIQLVPYGRDHSNPPVTAEPNWDSARTRALFMQTCGDCHSNETIWPWYSNVAPVSWLVQRDVNEGREKFNVSEWNRPQEGDEAAEAFQEGEMPPAQYLPTHPEARLQGADRSDLLNGLIATFGSEGGENNGDDD